MLGPAKPRRLDQPIAVSLEDLVPVDHFYRHLEAKLDLGFVRDWTRELYAEHGGLLSITAAAESSTCIGLPPVLDPAPVATASWPWCAPAR
jgi:hypothetical protein